MGNIARNRAGEQLYQEICTSVLPVTNVLCAQSDAEMVEK